MREKGPLIDERVETALNEEENEVVGIESSGVVDPKKMETQENEKVGEEEHARETSQKETNADVEEKEQEQEEQEQEEIGEFHLEEMPREVSSPIGPKAQRRTIYDDIFLTLEFGIDLSSLPQPELESGATEDRGTKEEKQLMSGHSPYNQEGRRTRKELPQKISYNDHGRLQASDSDPRAMLAYFQERRYLTESSLSDQPDSQCVKSNSNGIHILPKPTAETLPKRNNYVMSDSLYMDNFFVNPDVYSNFGHLTPGHASNKGGDNYRNHVVVSSSVVSNVFFCALLVKSVLEKRYKQRKTILYVMHKRKKLAGFPRLVQSLMARDRSVFVCNAGRHPGKFFSGYSFRTGVFTNRRQRRNRRMGGRGKRRDHGYGRGGRTKKSHEWRNFHKFDLIFTTAEVLLRALEDGETLLDNYRLVVFDDVKSVLEEETSFFHTILNEHYFNKNQFSHMYVHRLDSRRRRTVRRNSFRDLPNVIGLMCEQLDRNDLVSRLRGRGCVRSVFWDSLSRTMKVCKILRAKMTFFPDGDELVVRNCFKIAGCEANGASSSLRFLRSEFSEGTLRVLQKVVDRIESVVFEKNGRWKRISEKNLQELIDRSSGNLKRGKRGKSGVLRMLFDSLDEIAKNPVLGVKNLRASLPGLISNATSSGDSEMAQLRPQHALLVSQLSELLPQNDEDSNPTHLLIVESESEARTLHDILVETGKFSNVVISRDRYPNQNCRHPSDDGASTSLSTCYVIHCNPSVFESRGVPFSHVWILSPLAKSMQWIVNLRRGEEITVVERPSNIVPDDLMVHIEAMKKSAFETFQEYCLDKNVNKIKEYVQHPLKMTKKLWRMVQKKNEEAQIFGVDITNELREQSLEDLRLDARKNAFDVFGSVPHVKVKKIDNYNGGGGFGYVAKMDIRLRDDDDTITIFSDSKKTAEEACGACYVDFLSQLQKLNLYRKQTASRNDRDQQHESEANKSSGGERQRGMGLYMMKLTEFCRRKKYELDTRFFVAHGLFCCCVVTAVEAGISARSRLGVDRGEALDDACCKLLEKMTKV